MLSILHYVNPVSFKISKTNLCWLKNSHLWARATSIPRKYFKFPKSFILKHLLRYTLNFVQAYELFPASIMSSTYTNIPRKTSFFLYMKSVLSILDCVKPYSCKDVINFENQFLEACFKLYKDLCSLLTAFWLLELKPGGNLMYILSFRSPCKNGLFASMWWISHPFATTTAKKTRSNICFVTRANASI